MMTLQIFSSNDSVICIFLYASAYSIIFNYSSTIMAYFPHFSLDLELSVLYPAIFVYLRHYLMLLLPS